MTKSGSRWADIPEADKEKWNASVKARRQEAKRRKAERKRLGAGRNLTKAVRIQRDSLNRLRACAHMRRGLTTIAGDLDWIAFRYSLCEEVKRIVNEQYRHMTEQLEWLAATDPRAELCLEKARMLAAGWQ